MIKNNLKIQPYIIHLRRHFAWQIQRIKDRINPIVRPRLDEVIELRHCRVCEKATAHSVIQDVRAQCTECGLFKMLVRADFSGWMYSSGTDKNTND